MTIQPSLKFNNQLGIPLLQNLNEEDGKASAVFRFFKPLASVDRSRDER